MSTAPLKRFCIIIDQSMLTEIIVEATDLTAAEELAGRCYEGDETAIYQSKPEYGCWELIESEEVLP